MSQCQCKAGFFALRACENMAMGQCRVCGRFICMLHSAPESVMQMCRDCKAREAQQPESGTTTGDTSERYGDAWAHSYRDRYYGAGYRPMYSGSHHNHYDRQDAQSFVGNEGEIEDDDDPQAGFGDS